MVFEAINLHRQVPVRELFQTNKNIVQQRATMNEPSTHRTNWHYNCSVTYVTQQWKSSHENFEFTVA